MTARGRVLVVTNDFPPRRGGIESFVVSLCQALPPEEVVVYTARMDGAAAYDRTVAFPVVRDRARTLLPTPRTGRRVRAVLAEYGCEQVVFGAAAPLGLLAPGLRRAGVTTVVGLTHGHEVWWAAVPGARRLLRRIGDGADTLTYVSAFCRDEIAGALRPDSVGRLTRMSPGVDLERFTPAVDGQSLRRRWEIAPDRQVVLAASRLVARKGHDVLLDAWPRVLDTCPGALLLVVGSGPRRRALDRRVRRLGLAESVLIVAGVPWEDMPEVYAAADVFALPCRTRRWGLEVEALGLVFLEAAASGLPVVVGRSGGAPETVVEGQTGYVVEPLDPASVAERVVGLLAHPPTARGLGAAGRRFVGEHFAAADAAATLRRLLGRA